MDVFDTLTELTASRLRASILAPIVQPYADLLSEQRYSPHTVRQYLNCLAHFAHWSKRLSINTSPNSLINTCHAATAPRRCNAAAVKSARLSPI